MLKMNCLPHKRTEWKIQIVYTTQLSFYICTDTGIQTLTDKFVLTVMVIELNLSDLSSGTRLFPPQISLQHDRALKCLKLPSTWLFGKQFLLITTQKQSCSTLLVILREIHQWPVDSSNAECDSMSWRHHNVIAMCTHKWSLWDSADCWFVGMVLS